MNVLLDTHTLLWFLNDNPQLEQTPREIIENIENRVFVSVASIWEVAIKVGIGKLNLGERVFEFFNRQLPQNDLELLPISLLHAASVESLPQHHRDPFDRLIAVQSQLEHLPLVSRDVVFDQYGITRIW